MCNLKDVIRLSSHRFIENLYLLGNVYDGIPLLLDLGSLI